MNARTTKHSFHLAIAAATVLAIGSGCTQSDRAGLRKVRDGCGEALAPSDETRAEWKASNKDKAFDRIDAVFGSCGVAPMGWAFFYDVIFWDNTLSPEALIGKPTRAGEIIVSYDAAKGYEVKGGAQDVFVHELTPVLKEGSKQVFGPVTVTLKPSLGTMMAHVDAGTVNVTGYAVGPLARWAGAALKPLGGAFPPDAVIVQGLTPFPLVGVKKGAVLTIVPHEVRLPSGSIQIGAGSTVLHNGNETQVLSRLTTTATLPGNERKWVSADDVDTANKGNLALPLVVLWLVLGATFFTFRMSFINLRGFFHALAVTRGDYDDPDDPGEISHFQALSSALSATVGLGNIAGVAVAVAIGGPGALLWMVLAGFLGMSSKFVECTAGQMYRTVDSRGAVSGGPMRYLRVAFEQRGMPKVGGVIATFFAVMCIGGSFGGGNMFQANQATAALVERIPSFEPYKWTFGVFLAILVALVIIGGIKRIGRAASVVVPLMCGLYVLAGLYILIVNGDKIPWAIGTIIDLALDPSGDKTFIPRAAAGGLVGILIVGFQRAAFSNEAGVGSASIAHSAAATEEPVREGIVAMVGPFIDTIVICTMTGLVVVITGAYKMVGADGEPLQGVEMTSAAFESAISWFPWLLAVAVFLFAFSTMISWSYYGERCFTLLFGENTTMIYRGIFVVFVFLGAVFDLGTVLDFSDLMILGMAFPNILGAVLLSGKVRGALDDYWTRYKAGEMKSHRE